jgi:group II intron reverse transcriptase/maturase
MKQLTLRQNKTDLFEAITSPEQLGAAFKLVKANRGAEGVDGVSIEEFEANLKEELGKLSEELRSWKYIPQPARRVEIPKPGSQEKRKLGIPTVRDRVLHQSIRMSLEPLYEPDFSKSSYGFRPGRGQQDALEAARAIQQSGKAIVVDIDLEKFFDRINHDRLINTLKAKVDKKVLRLIGMILRSGIMHGDKFEASTTGSPQGSPLSPLLSNIVLDELDKELERRGLEFCRYADDAKIFVRSYAAGNRVMRSVSRFIEKRLKLSVNAAKSKVVKASEMVFLGYVATRRHVYISKKSMKRAREKLRELIPRRSHIPFEAQVDRFNQWYRGWSNYYKLTNYPYQLQMIEAHARRRFRAQKVAGAKRRRFLVRKLIKLGAAKGSVWKRIYQGKDRTWKLSNSYPVQRVWSNQWFRQQGLLDVSHKGLPHWRSVKQRRW